MQQQEENIFLSDGASDTSLRRNWLDDDDRLFAQHIGAKMMNLDSSDDIISNPEEMNHADHRSSVGDGESVNEILDSLFAKDDLEVRNCSTDVESNKEQALKNSSADELDLSVSSSDAFKARRNLSHCETTSKYDGVIFLNNGHSQHVLNHSLQHVDEPIFLEGGSFHHEEVKTAGASPVKMSSRSKPLSKAASNPDKTRAVKEKAPHVGNNSAARLNTKNLKKNYVSGMKQFLDSNKGREIFDMIVTKVSPECSKTTAEEFVKDILRNIISSNIDNLQTMAHGKKMKLDATIVRNLQVFERYLPSLPVFGEIMRLFVRAYLKRGAFPTMYSQRATESRITMLSCLQDTHSKIEKEEKWHWHEPRITKEMLDDFAVKEN